MSNYTLGSALRESNIGVRVDKVGVLTADDDLFNVYGECLITLMYGVVTTVMDGGASTVALNEKASSIAISAATTITSDALGTVYVVTGQTGALLNGGDAPTVAVGMAGGQHTSTVVLGNSVSPWIMDGGTAGLIIESTQTGADTGGITWSIFYLPLEEGAYISAAA
ncbi:MAG TPA: hypothetical protein DCP69_00770 [Candidatus Omnitrophica bacterium]|nr:hypothetical protein [Candidatus Omnitrophota bacterium]